MNADFTKVVHPCDAPQWDGKRWPVFCKIEFKGGRLSITGVIGPKRNGDAHGSCGQIDGEFDHMDDRQNDKRSTDPILGPELNFAPGWKLSTWYKFLDVWHVWHLNDMRAYCEHMTGPEWDASKTLTITRVGPGSAWHSTRRAAEDGTLNAEAYKQWTQDAEAVRRIWLEEKPAHANLFTAECKDLIKRGYLRLEASEQKTAGWIQPNEHPDGILGKACPVCGYKYGSAWRKEDVPAAVIEFLQALPNTDIQPAWV